ncbi:MAG: hypothetical protein P4M09_16850 [Devosia sp.]|nr:hypothetical protein [Devosia sp.]
MALVLGSLIFTDYSIPEKVTFGGKQSLAIHRLLGGTRVIDTMGPDESDISWSGRFQGSSASSQARALDALRQSGTEVSLVFGVNFYTVVVSETQCDYERSYQIPYRVTCTVVSTLGGVLQALVSTLDDLVSGDLSQIGTDLSSFSSAAIN